MSKAEATKNAKGQPARRPGSSGVRWLFTHYMGGSEHGLGARRFPAAERS